MRKLAITLIPLFLVACSRDLTAPNSTGLSVLAAVSQSASNGTQVFQGASSAGVSKQPISGTIDFVGGQPPARVFATPSGRCHTFGSPTVTQWTGDISGTVTFQEDVHAPCDFSDLVASGPFSGQVTWNGRTGTISGQWTTNCTADATQPIGLSCGGTMTARGSGGLDGVQFHFSWGPGWYPFSYTGTAFAR